MATDYSHRANKSFITKKTAGYSKKHKNRMIVLMIISLAMITLLSMPKLISKNNYGKSSYKKFSKTNIEKNIKKEINSKKFEFYNTLPNMQLKLDNNSLTNNQAKKAYIVQLAAFKNPDGASKLKDNLKEIEIDSSIRKIQIKPGNVWYHVYLGPFNSYSLANKAQAKLQKNNITETVVLKTLI